MADTMPVSVQSLSQRLETLAAAEPSASPETLKPMQNLPDDAAPGEVVADTLAPQGPADESRLKLSDEFVTRAQQTAARVRFIENPDLLADVGGVGALLRFRI